MTVALGTNGIHRRAAAVMGFGVRDSPRDMSSFSIALSASRTCRHHCLVAAPMDLRSATRANSSAHEARALNEVLHLPDKILE